METILALAVAVDDLVIRVGKPTDGYIGLVLTQSFVGLQVTLRAVLQCELS